MAPTRTTPAVTWAQRSTGASESNIYYNKVIVTITAPNVPADKYKLQVADNKISFEGVAADTTYAFELELFGDVDGDAAQVKHSGNNFELIVPKKEQTDEYWPRLAKAPGKLHNVNTDFDKWVDEDEQDEEADANPEGFGGMPPGMMDMNTLNAMGGMGGPGGMGGLEGLGGLGGLGDLSNLDMSNLPAGSDDDEDLDGADDDEAEPADKAEPSDKAAAPKSESTSAAAATAAAAAAAEGEASAEASADTKA